MIKMVAGSLFSHIFAMAMTDGINEYYEVEFIPLYNIYYFNITSLTLLDPNDHVVTVYEPVSVII